MSGSCRHVHYPPEWKTLYQVVTGCGQRQHQANKIHQQQSDIELELSHQASAGETDPEDDGTGMEMLYHVCIPLVKVLDVSKDEEDDTNNNDNNDTSGGNNFTKSKMSDQVTRYLAQHDIPLASLVYIALDAVLVWDRYRGGLLLPSSDNENTSTLDADRASQMLLETVLLASTISHTENDKGRRRVLERGSSSSSAIDKRGDVVVVVAVQDDDSATQQKQMHLLLPATVLEHVLTFLPDAAVAAASAVCRHWHAEIGKKSPHLWKHLLERRTWPVPAAEATAATVDDKHKNMASPTATLYRDEFLKHYSVVRDVTALGTGLSAIATTAVPSNSSGSSKKKQTTSPPRTATKEMAFQDFSNRQYAPSPPNDCVSIQTWSPNRVLAAYSQDCSLRLFESASTSSTRTGRQQNKESSDEMQCRELVCQIVDPYRRTKKKRCCIYAVALDEECIGCLCHVESANFESEAFELVVVTREEFLVAGEHSGRGDGGRSSSFSDDLNLIVIDIGQAVINFLLSCDDGDMQYLETQQSLVEHFADGGTRSDIEVLASNTIAACGYGCFVVEVSILLPDYEDGVRLLGRQLVLFSAKAGIVKWMRESSPMTQPARPSDEDMKVACLRRSIGRTTVCYVAIGSESSPAIMVGELDDTGRNCAIRTLEHSTETRAEMAEDEGWELPSSFRKSILITPSDVVVADEMARIAADGDVQETKSFISFYPLHQAGNAVSDCTTLQLPGRMRVNQMVCIRDQYAIAVCSCESEASADTDRGGAEDGGTVGGHWLRGPQNSAGKMDIIGLVYHVPTRCQIGHLCLIRNATTSVPILTTDSAKTLAAALSWHGLVMTGSDVRKAGHDSSNGVGNNEPASPRSIKRKKKGRSKRETKKDEFARGMRMSY